MEGANGFTSVNANSPPTLPDTLPVNGDAAAGIKRKRESKSAPKFYAVRVGKEPGIYHTWSDCLNQVRGYPKAAFKSFSTQAEAEGFLNNQDGNTGGGRHGSKGEGKFYGVQVGRKPGVYSSWPEVLEQITGWRAPKHKVFKTRAEAELFVAEGQFQQHSYSNGYGMNGDDGLVQSIEPADNIDVANKRLKTTKTKKNGIKDEESSPSPTALVASEYPPGEAPLPTNTTDGFDSNVTLDQQSGTLRYKTASEFAATKLVASTPLPSAYVRIYTDGSALGNGGLGANGGVGVFFGPADKRNISEPLSGSRQTNQRAELTAILRALEVGPKDRKLEIVTDSNYAIKCVTEWSARWRSNGWVNSAGKPVENRDLIGKLIDILEERQRLNRHRSGAGGEQSEVGWWVKEGGKERIAAEKTGQPYDWGPAGVKFTWVKGHAKDEGNTAADALAVNGAKVAREFEQDLGVDD